jgi:SAM-dependent methyltransferase
VSDEGQRAAELGQLIDADAVPAVSPLGRIVRRLWSRAARAQVGHQREIDHRLLELVRAQGETVARSESALVELTAELSVLRQEVGNLRTWCAGIADEVNQDRRGFSRELSTLSRRVPDAAPLYGSGAFTLERFDAGLGGEVAGFRGAGSDDEAAVYLGFEDFFRGAEGQIRERQLAYMPLLSGRAPVLDVGCGRGEMLELLRERRVEAGGVDIDPAMVEHCLAKGLERVQVADGVGYLEEAQPGSLGAVFAAQVIEHLPYPALLRLLRAARRALAPGGLVVLETVNPHAPQALKHFWIDPTHQHPLFPEVVVALCRLTGFAGAYVWHPQGGGDPDRDRIEQLDYAVVAEAPAAARDGSPLS